MGRWVACLIPIAVEEVSAVCFENPPKPTKLRKNKHPKQTKNNKQTTKTLQHVFQKQPKFSEPWQVCLFPYLGSEIPLKSSWVCILNPPPLSTYTVSCEDRYHRPTHIRATSFWHETPLSQQLTHSAFVSAFCFALWRVCYSSPIPSWQKYG